MEKRTPRFSKKDVKFNPHLKLYKIEGMGRGLFEKYLYECLKENYPELKAYQDLANEINEKYYSDKYGDFAISFEPTFTWNSKGTKVTKIGIRACNSLASNPKERTNKNIHRILRQEIRDKYGLNLEKDVKSSVPRVTYGLAIGGWVKDEVDLYKKIYEKYDPNGEFNDEYRQAIKDLFFRVYFDDSNDMLGKNIWFKISNSGLNKEDVYKEVIKLREATMEALGGVDYSSEIFFVESCIYMDVLKMLLDEGFLVWQVYDCFYAKGLGTQEEFERYVKDAVYLSFVNYKFKKDYCL